jgi:helix-turn-helix protein
MRRNDAHAAKPLPCGLQGESGVSRDQRTTHSQRDCRELRGASASSGAGEDAGAGSSTRRLVSPARAGGTRRRSVKSPTVPADWSTQSRVGLAQKKLDSRLEVTRQFVEPGHPFISVRRPCQVLGLSRAGLYDQPAGESPENLTVMRLLDAQYTRTPLYGVLRMTAWLKQQGYGVNAKRVRRLLRLMGLEAIYPKPHVSRAAAEHRVYPYLLKFQHNG